MSVWTINGTPAADLGVSVAGFAFRSREAGEVVMEIASNDYAAASVIAVGASVVIQRDSVDFFRGKVYTDPSNADPDAERSMIVVRDVWAELERLPYMQLWYDYTAGSVLTPRVVLGMTAGGSKIDTMATISAILDYAIAQGVAVVKNVLAPGVAIEPTEATNISCAEAIRQMLRFHPAVSVAASYSGTTTLTFRERDQMTALTLPHIASETEPVQSASATPHPEMVPDCVALFYEAADQIDGEILRRIYPDIYPAGKTGREVGAVSEVVPLVGHDMSINKNPVKTRTIPASTAATNIDAWWFDHLPFRGVAGVTSADIEVVADSHTRALEPDPADDNGAPPPVNPRSTTVNSPSDTPDDLPRELIEGQLADWMRKKSRGMICSARIKWVGGAMPQEVADVFGTATEIPVKCVVTATNAQSKIYKGLANWSTGDNVPTGLAEALYTRWSPLPWSGSVTLVAEEVMHVAAVGFVLNISGGKAAWSTMKAMVTEVTGDIASGTTTISYGAHGRLGTMDYIELLKARRNNQTTWWQGAERSSGSYGNETDASARPDIVANTEVPRNEWLGGGGGGGAALPLTASIAETDPATELAVTGGAYQVGAGGAWVTIPPTAATAGTKVWLVINQKADRTLADTDPVTILINSAVLDAVVITPADDPDPETAVSNVLIAEVVAGELVQRRHGNFTLMLDHIDGDFVRWPATVAGSIPTPAP